MNKNLLLITCKLSREEQGVRPKYLLSWKISETPCRLGRGHPHLPGKVSLGSVYLAHL